MFNQRGLGWGTWGRSFLYSPCRYEIGKTPTRHIRSEAAPSAPNYFLMQSDTRKAALAHLLVRPKLPLLDGFVKVGAGHFLDAFR